MFESNSFNLFVCSHRWNLFACCIAPTIHPMREVDAQNAAAAAAAEDDEETKMRNEADSARKRHNAIEAERDLSFSLCKCYSNFHVGHKM